MPVLRSAAQAEAGPGCVAAGSHRPGAALALRAASAPGRRSCRRSPRARGARPRVGELLAGQEPPRLVLVAPAHLPALEQAVVDRRAHPAVIGRCALIVERRGGQRASRLGRRRGMGRARDPQAGPSPARRNPGGQAVSRLWGEESHRTSCICLISQRLLRGSARPPRKEKLAKWISRSSPTEPSWSSEARSLFLIVSFFNWFSRSRTASFRREHVARRRRSSPDCSPSRCIVWEAAPPRQHEARDRRSPRRWSTAALAVLLLVFTFIRFIASPAVISSRSVDRTFWAWLGLMLAILIVVGAWWNMKALGESIAEMGASMKTAASGAAAAAKSATDKGDDAPAAAPAAARRSRCTRSAAAARGPCRLPRRRAAPAAPAAEPPRQLPRAPTTRATTPPPTPA